MLKVLFVAENLSYGGAQKMLTFVANNLDRRKFKVALLNQDSNTTIARPLNQDIEYYEHSRFVQKCTKRLKELSNLIKIIKKAKPDVIVSFLVMPNLLSTIAGRLTKTPVIISERGDPSRNMRRVMRFFRWIERNASGAVFQTEGAKRFYHKKLQDKATIIPNPVVSIKLSSDFCYNNKIRKIAFVGRFENEQKRQDLAIKAISTLKKSYNDVILNFYGGGPDERIIKEIVRQEGIKENVIFYGKTLTPQEELLKNDIFLITSDYEGIPNALIEAMSIGMPCVATDCTPGGAALLIKNEENGLLVNRGDVESIANALKRFITNPEFARGCGEKAREINQLYSPEKIIKKWEQYIEQICVKKKRKKKNLQLVL